MTDVSEATISVENLVKMYGHLAAVNDISFQVKRGEIFGFLGPNGAGKTTTINILCTLSSPTSGRAIINGYDVAKQQSQVRQSIGLVFQDPSLDERLSALQNMRFHAMVYNIPSSVREERIERFMRMVELWDKRNQNVRTYSGGMKRRLELARGLLHNPRVLFLDEPTLGLDPQTRNHIWSHILDMREREGTTIFLTTHYMQEAENADRIAVIDHGRLVAMDNPAGLKNMVGRDIVTVKALDGAAEEISRRYGAEARRDGNEFVFEVPSGEEFVPRFIREFGSQIASINLRHPSLEDVFIKLTGREIREEEGVDQMKAMVQAHGRRSRR